jgi:hypothetical protein
VSIEVSIIDPLPCPRNGGYVHAKYKFMHISQNFLPLPSAVYMYIYVLDLKPPNY